MKYEDFEKFVRETCMYDTIYEDSDGRQILIIQMLDAYGMVDKALRARLAQPEPAECDGGQCGIGGYCKQCPKTQLEQEPVAWGVPNTRPTEKAQFMMLLHSPDGCQYPEQLVPLYTAPPKKELVGLTDEEYEAMAEHYVTNCYFDTLEYARAITTKLKEKNT